MTIPRPQLEALSDGRQALTADYTVTIVECLSWAVTVPTGTITDGASIPRWLWPVVGPPIRSRYFPAAIVHDYLCGLAQDNESYTLRVLADGVFFLLLGRLGVPGWKRAAMYAGVRWGTRYLYCRVSRSRLSQ